MPTASERAALEVEQWLLIAGHWAPEDVPELYDDLPPSERDVVVFYDPATDLERRTSAWGYALERLHLDELALFAGGLAEAEAAAWSDDVPDLAMRAYEQRRLLMGDRIIHWAVPWLDAVAVSFPEHRDQARFDRDLMLDLGDEMRVAPALAGSEGLAVPGEDAFGPLSKDAPLETLIGSLWSGSVILGRAIGLLLGDPARADRRSTEDVLANSAARSKLARSYRDGAAQWTSTAGRHPGTAALWLDLATRGRSTAGILNRDG